MCFFRFNICVKTEILSVNKLFNKQTEKTHYCFCENQTDLLSLSWFLFFDYF